jgi:ABC-2 type transport system ATP-binding protein
MQEVEAMCTRVIIINKGKIVADDSIENLQKKSDKEYIITVELKDEVSPNLFASLNGLVQTEQNGKLYRLKTKSDSREELAKLAQQNNWLILSMKVEENSLEEVFQLLTK